MRLLRQLQRMHRPGFRRSLRSRQDVSVSITSLPRRVFGGEDSGNFLGEIPGKGKQVLSYIDF